MCWCGDGAVGIAIEMWILECVWRRIKTHLIEHAFVAYTKYVAMRMYKAVGFKLFQENNAQYTRREKILMVLCIKYYIFWCVL